MQYVLGIDSGGTKYLVRAYTPDGKSIAEYTGVACHHYYIGMEETKKRMDKNIQECLKLFGGKREDCLYIVSGTSGLDSPEDEAMIKEAYESLEGFNCPMHCINDAELAHYTATEGVGALLIAGTGSIAFGKDEKGNSARVGGWVFSIMSDEGSGAYITRQALHHLSRYFDGCVEKTQLIDLIDERLNISTRKQLMDFAMQIATPPWELPSLSIEVNTAAENGDPYALAILKDAAKCTFSLADAVVQKLSLANLDRFKVGVWGSAIVKSKIHFSEFKALFEQKYQNVDVIIPDEDAATGACKMAIALLNK